MATVKLDLPAPTVVGAANGYLDLEKIPGNEVKVQVPAYGGRVADQWVYVEFNGQNGSQETTAKRRVPDSSTVMDFTISKAEVLKSDKQAVVFEYKVALTEGALYTTSRPSALELGEGVGRGAIDFERFAIGELGLEPIDLGFGVVLTSPVRHRIASGYQAPPYIVGKYLEADIPRPGPDVTLTIYPPAIKFSIAASTTTPAAYILYYEGGGIGTGYFDGTKWIEIETSETGKRLSSIRFQNSSSGILKLDNITVN